jgi:uncharacterized protein HemX
MPPPQNPITPPSQNPITPPSQNPITPPIMPTTPANTTQGGVAIPIIVLIIALIIGIVLYFVFKNKNSQASVNNIIAAFGKIW